MRLKATKTDYVIKPDPEKEVTVGTIIVPNKSTEGFRMNTGTILSKGPKCVFHLCIGDKIFYDHMGVYAKYGILNTILPEKNVICKVGKKKAPIMIDDNILLKEVEQEKKRIKGIYTVEPAFTKWEIVQISETAKECPAEIGDIIIIDKKCEDDFANNHLIFNGEKFNMIDHKYIAATI